MPIFKHLENKQQSVKFGITPLTLKKLRAYSMWLQMVHNFHKALCTMHAFTLFLYVKCEPIDLHRILIVLRHLVYEMDNNKS